MSFNVELLLILLFSIVGGVLAVRFKQPSILGLLLVGVIVGPNALGLISDGAVIEASIEIGAVLLLFTLGIEFNIKKLLNLGITAVIVAVLKLGIVFLAGHYTALLFGFDFITSLAIGIIISITSTVIFIKILEQKGHSKSQEVPLLITVLIMEDIYAIFALTFFSSLKSTSVLNPFNIFKSLIISFTVLIIAYLVIQRIIKPIIQWLVKYKTDDTFTFISLGILGLMSYLAILLKLSPSIGAFLAGNIVASLPNAKNFETSIHPFILTFVSLFFFSIGTIVDISVVYGSIYFILTLFLVNLVSKFFSIGFSSYLFSNLTGKQAVFSGVAMLSVGEFSLLIAKEASEGVGVDLVSLTAAIILLSSFSMSSLINYSEKIYASLRNIAPKGISNSLEGTSKFINGISFSVVKNKSISNKILKDWKVILNHTLSLLIIIISGFLIWNFFNEFLLKIIANKTILSIVFIFAIIAVFFPAFNILKNAVRLSQNVLKLFTKLLPNEKSNEKKIFASFSLILILFMVLLLIPGLSVFFKIHPIFHIFAIILIFGILIYCLRCSKLIQNLVKRHGPAFNNFSKKYKEKIEQKVKYDKIEYEQ